MAQQDRNPRSRRSPGGKIKRAARRCFAAACALLLIGAAALWALDRLFPLPPVNADGAVVVVAADGTPLRNYASRDGVWRYAVTPDQVSPVYLQALLTYEDRWFRWHPGVNPVALARAAWQWAVHGHIVSGGSTLTMQVARMIDPKLAGQSSHSMALKLRQTFRALQLEMHYSKDQILSIYLSRAPMGGIVQGVEMGARLWLGKSARDLDPAESALLTVLPQAPSRLRPDRHPEAARQARDKVLDRMVELGRWTTQAVDDAKIEPVVAPPLRARWLAPLAAQRLVRQADAQDKAQGRPRRPAIIQTTLDAELQDRVEHILLDHVGALPPKVSIAALVMRNDTLEIKAYAGSVDFSDDSRYAHVDMVTGVRSPGSTLKPFLYGMAFDDGLIHSESLLLDEPLSFDGYAPGDFEVAFSGPVSAAQALQRSLNVPAVDLLHRIGPERFAAAMLAAGVRLRMPPGAQPNLSLILGGAGTTLEELVGAYRALAHDGQSGQPRLQPTQPIVEARVMSPGAAWIVRDILENGGHPDRPYDPAQGRRLAWKTGTSFGFRDAWAIGVTDDWTLGVWVGRPDGTPNPGYFGANIAAPLVRDIVNALPQGIVALSAPSHAKPDSVQAVATCWPFGVRVGAMPNAQCAQPHLAWVLNDTVPPTFTGYADAAQRPFTLTGLAEGAVLRPTPGQNNVSVDVQTQGAEGEVWWMLDGRAIGHAGAGRSFTLSLTRNGRYTLTAMDGRGRYDRIQFNVVGAQ